MGWTALADEKKKDVANDADAGVKASVIKMLSIIGLVSAIGGFAVLFSFWSRSGPPDQYETLRIASREYVNGNIELAGDLAKSVTLAAELVDDSEPKEKEPDAKKKDSKKEDAVEGDVEDGAESDVDKPWVQLKLFLTSAAEYHRASDESDPRARRVLLADVVPLLEKSAIAGYPPGRESEGQRYLGDAFYELGQYEKSAVALRRAIERDPTLSRQLISQLAMAELRSRESSPDQSLATIARLLQDPSISAMQAQEAERIQIESLIELGRYDEANDVIAKRLEILNSDPTQLSGEVRESRDELMLLRSVAEIRKVIDQHGPLGSTVNKDNLKIEARLSEPLDQLFDLQRESSPRVSSRARIWSGRALLYLGDIDGALAELTSVRQQRPFGAEAATAAIEEVELLAQAGRGLEMLQTVRYISRELGDPRAFDSSMMPFADFRKRLSSAVDQLRQTGEFEYSIDIARSLPPLVDANQALFQEAMGYQEWAEATLREGTSPVGEVARSASSTARGYFRLAGDAFAASAKLDFDTEQYLTSLWLAIDAYQKGRHFTRSEELLKPYLRYEERTRQSRGMVAYGRVLLADGKVSQAIQTLNECIMEFPRDPLRYDARLLAALAYSEKGDVPNAKKLLLDNLQDGELTPSSPAWRDSLYSLGEISFRVANTNVIKANSVAPEERTKILRENQAEVKTAIRYLDEIVERNWPRDGEPFFWPSERAQSASYLRSQAHVLASVWPREEAESPEILDAARRVLRAEAEAELETARAGFQSLSRLLTQREEESRLSVSSESLLRNSLVFEADTLRSLKRLDEAIDAYRDISSRYVNEPVALEAMLGHARCAKDLGRNRESEGIIRQALVVLQRIQPEHDDAMARTTRHDRAGWEKLLTWMTNRFDNNNNGA